MASSSSSTCSNNTPLPVDLVPIDPKLVEQYNEAPVIAQKLITMLRPNGEPYNVYRGEYTARITLTRDHIVNGAPRVLSIGVPIGRPLQPYLEQARGSNTTFCMLSAEVDHVESSFDNALSCQLDLRRKVRSCDLAQSFNPGEHVARSIVVEPRHTWSYRPKVPLLVEPLLYHDRSEPITFTAIDAWGFDAEKLLKHIAVELSGDRYYIPSTYRYSYLIANVHVCIKLANARAHQNSLYADSMTNGIFALPASRSGYEIAKHDLDAVIEFIEIRLLSALVKFDPKTITVNFTPFGTQTWNDMYQRHNAALTSTASLRTVPPVPSAPMVCVVHIIVHFALLDAAVTATIQQDGTLGGDNSSLFIQSVAPAPPQNNSVNDDNGIVES